MAERLEQPELDAIREVRDKAKLRSAHLAVAQAELDLLVTKAFVAHCYNTETHTVCLDCGTFTHRSRACDCGGPDGT